MKKLPEGRSKLSKRESYCLGFLFIWWAGRSWRKIIDTRLRRTGRCPLSSALEVQQKMWDWHKRDRENDSLAAIAGQTTWTRWQRSPDNGQCISVYLVVVAVASAFPSPPPSDYCLVVAATMNKKDCEVWFDTAEEQESMSHVNTKDHFISTEWAQCTVQQCFCRDK